MSDGITEFFDRLAGRGDEPLLGRVKGTVRFDLTTGPDTERWLVAIDRGAIVVSHRNVKADCTIHADRELFAGIAAGRVNAMAALLRGAMGFEGEPKLLVSFQRLFPEPPRSAGRPKAVTSEGAAS